jgi:hypothetical protein
MFPDSDDLPSSFLEPRVGIAVAALVGLDLLPPKVGVASGPGPMLGAAMPEAAVNEDGHPCGGECNIDAPAFVGQDGRVYSVAEASRVQHSPELHLGRRTSSTDFLHPTTCFWGGRRDRRRIRSSEGQAAISCVSVIIDFRWA